MPQNRAVRWWPLILILAGCAAWVAWTWLPSRPNRQQQVLGTAMGVVVGFVLALVWLVVFSRMRWRKRFAILGSVAAVLVASALLLRFEGVSGDLVPKFGFRWSGAAPAHEGPARAGAAASPVPAETAADYPQFLGPDRNAVVQVALDPDWKARPPREVWRRAVGAGWSGFAVHEGLAITQEQRGDHEVVAAYALADGAPIWKHEYLAHYEHPMVGDGPRATPTIADGRVFALGATGWLTALDFRSGRALWSRNVLDENAARPPMYGVSASPLVVEHRVIVPVGGAGGSSFMAYDVTDGTVLWAGGKDRTGYSSAALGELAGIRQAVILTEENVLGHSVEDGSVLWKHPWPPATEYVSTPLILPGDRVFQSTGYGVGSMLFRIAERAGRLEAEVVWESRSMKTKFTHAVPYEDHLYGLDDGILACIALQDGSRRWKAGRYGHGHVLLARDLLVVQTEDGEVVLVQANPERLVETGRFRPLDGRCWNTPALAGAYLLLRNDREAACYELPLELRSASR